MVRQPVLSRVSFVEHGAEAGLDEMPIGREGFFHPTLFHDQDDQRHIGLATTSKRQ